MTILYLESTPVSDARGAGALNFRAYLHQPSVSDVTFAYRPLTNGTTLSSDFNFPLAHGYHIREYTIPAGETSVDIPVYLAVDNLDEADESVTMELYNLKGAGVQFDGGGPSLRSVGIILDDGGSAASNIALHISDPVVIEGDKGATTVEFELILSTPAAETTTFSYATKNGSAVSGSDYEASTGDVTFSKGQDKATVRVKVFGDEISEDSELFSLAVSQKSGPSVNLSGATGVAEIRDDDNGPGPIVSMTGYSILEMYGGQIHFTVSLNEPSESDVTFSYRPIANAVDFDNDLNYPLDHGYHNGEVTIPAGETSVDIFIYAIQDTKAENDESIILELYGLSDGASFAGGGSTLSRIAFILDDDAGGHDIALAGAPVIAKEDYDGTVILDIPVELSRPARDDLVFNVSAPSGSAEANIDFRLLTSQVSFVEGQDIASVKVEIHSDSVLEGIETFDILFDLKSGSVFSGETNSLTVTIQDDPVFTEGDDVVTLFGVRDDVKTLGGNDIVDGGGGNDRVRAGAGNDEIKGGDGNDKLFGDDGDDKLYGNSGKDKINGGKGNDVIDGGNEDDKLIGNGGNDTIDAGKGNDRIKAGGGKDMVIGGKGDDVVSGNGGADTFFFQKGYGSDEVTDFKAGVDMIEIGRGAQTFEKLNFEQSSDNVVMSFKNVDVTFLNITVAELADTDNFLF